MTGSRRPIGEPLRPLRFAYATTEVPADYDHPDTDMLELAVLRAVSTHPNRERIGSMLINPGGPGGSGLDAAVSNALAFADELLAGFAIGACAGPRPGARRCGGPPSFDA